MKNPLRKCGDSLNVTQFVANFLAENGVTHVFGYQGGAVIKLIDSIVATGSIRYTQNYHEQACAFCADAYSRINGNFGVAIATSGPGATNLITGIANAHLDSIPTLFITGQEYSSRIKKKNGVRSNGFQDLDIVEVVKTITKYAVVVTDAQRIAYELEKALYLAKSERPGAVLIDIPIDIQFQEIDEISLEHFIPNTQETNSINQDDVKKFIALLKAAKRPMILGGGGIMLAGAQDTFKKFVKETHIPVALTLNGLDIHENYVGFSGLYGNINACIAVYNADLLIVIGARLGQHQVGKAKSTYTNAKIVHIDIDELELGRTMPEELSIRSDLKVFLDAVNSNLATDSLPDYHEWLSSIHNWTLKYAKQFASTGIGVSPTRLIHETQKYFDSDAVITADVGQNQMWVAQTLRLHGHQRLLNSSGLGSMGYALPAAIAAKLCRPKSTVIAFMGDGGFQMNIQELQLVKLKKLNIKLFIFNNGALGLIKSTQDKYFKNHELGCTYPDFDCVNLKAIAAAYDLNYFKICADSDINLLHAIFDSNQATLVEVLVDSEYPLKTRADMTSIFLEEIINV